MAFDETWTLATKALCNNGDWLWTGSVNGDHDIQDENTATYWCWTDTGSTSSSTGPPSGTGCAYPETSSPTTVGDTHTAEMEAAAEVDASAYSLNVTFDLCMQGDAAGEMAFEAWDGTTWNEIDSFNGDTTTTFTSQGPYDFGPDDLDYDNDDFKVRFTVTVGGTTYHNDFAFCEVRIYGEDKVTITKGAGMILASAEDLQGTAAAEDPGTFDFVESLPWGAITLALRNDPGSSSSNLDPTDKFTTLKTLGTIYVRNGATINGLILNANVVLEEVTDLTDVIINGNLTIEVGGTYAFSNVVVSAEIENTDATANVLINASNGSSYGTLNNEGTGNGQEQFINTVNFKFTVSPSVTGYEWRLYEVTALGSLAGSVEKDGEEVATADNQTYPYSYSEDQPIAVQIIDLVNDFVERTVYFTLGNADQDVTIELTKDINN